MSVRMNIVPTERLNACLLKQFFKSMDRLSTTFNHNIANYEGISTSSVWFMFVLATKHTLLLLCWAWFKIFGAKFFFRETCVMLLFIISIQLSIPGVPKKYTTLYRCSSTLKLDI